MLHQYNISKIPFPSFRVDNVSTAVGKLVVDNITLNVDGITLDIVSWKCSLIINRKVKMAMGKDILNLEFWIWFDLIKDQPVEKVDNLNFDNPCLFH